MQAVAQKSTETLTDLESHRVSLMGHCYRMLGSSTDAEDAVQEALLRAWRARSDFDGRSSLRHWLHRIATNVCLDALASRKRRTRPVIDGPEGSVDDVLEQHERTHWIEPVPDAKAIPTDVGADELIVLRQSVRLAFVAALQNLTPRERAALLLTEVLGWSVAETAESLNTTPAAINSALQRARATMAKTPAQTQKPLTAAQAHLIDQYVAAFERYDVASMLDLFHEDATLSMPPFRLWLRGRDSMARWLLGRGSGCRGSRLIPTWACASPAMGQYRPNPNGGYRAWALIVLEHEGEKFSAMNSFLDVETLFPLFGMPLSLSA